MSAALLFASTFALVFCLGMQSLLVRDDRRRLAFVNSFCIGAFNLVLFKLAPDAGAVEIAAYLCGGPVGIVSAMAVFGWFARRRKGGKTPT